MPKTYLKFFALLLVVAMTPFVGTPKAQAQLCPGSLCLDDAHCEEICPSASWAICSSSYACEYGYSGSGPSNPSPICPGSICMDAQDCLDACPRATSAVCDSNNSCRY